MGRITNISKSGYSNSYSYTNDNLSTISHNGFNYNFIYDTFGNTKQVKVNDKALITNNYASNNGNLLNSLYGNNQSVSYEYDRFNRVIKKITYDQIGNPLTYDTYTYEWINGRQLSKIIDNTNTYQYKYNDSGIREEKLINGISTKYYLEGSKIIYQTDGPNTIYYMYDETGSIIGLKYNSNEYYYIKNAQNDIIGLLDSNLNKIVNY